MLQVFDLFGFGDGLLSAGDLPHSGRQGRKPSENYLDVENEAKSWSESRSTNKSFVHTAKNSSPTYFHVKSSRKLVDMDWILLLVIDFFNV